MNTIIIFGITVHIDQVAFTIPGINWSVYWYGIFIATGVLLALWYGMKNGNRFGINPDHIFNTFVVTLPCCVLGARAYYILFDSGIKGFAHFFDFSGKGFAGLAIYGGIIMAAVCIFVFQRVYKFSVLAALDITSVGLFIGQAIGRWGNFVNQEAYGTFTGSNWFGMTGNIISNEMGTDALVHPCFLYESIWCLIGFFLLNHFSKKRVFKGQIALMYGMWYGFERCFVEMLRTDSLMLGNIRVSSMLSAVVCILCAVAFTLLMKKHKNDSVNYELQFGYADEITVASGYDESDEAESDLSEPDVSDKSTISTETISESAIRAEDEKNTENEPEENSNEHN